MAREASIRPRSLSPVLGPISRAKCDADERHRARPPAREGDEADEGHDDDQGHEGDEGEAD